MSLVAVGLQISTYNRKAHIYVITVHLMSKRQDVPPKRTYLPNCTVPQNNVNFPTFFTFSEPCIEIYLCNKKQKKCTLHFYIHGFVHRESNLVTVQQDATVFSLMYFCRLLYMFRELTPIIRSSYNCNYSFWHWTNGSTTIRSRCWAGSRPSWPVPEAVITVVLAPDDGCQQPKHVERPTEI